MKTESNRDCIRVLIADDDQHVLDAYRDAFTEPESTREMRVLDALAAELFDPDDVLEDQPHFEVVACSQGDAAVSLSKTSST